MNIDLQFDTIVLETYIRERITQALAERRECFTAPISYSFVTGFAPARPEPTIVDRIAVRSVLISSDPPTTDAFGVPALGTIRRSQRVMVPSDAGGPDLDQALSVPAVQVNVDVELRLVAAAALRDADSERPDASRSRTLVLRVKLLMTLGSDAVGANLQLRPEYYGLYLMLGTTEIGLETVASTIGISIPPTLDATFRELQSQLPRLELPVSTLSGVVGGGLRLWNAGARVTRHGGDLVTDGRTSQRVLTLRLQFGRAFPPPTPPAIVSTMERNDRRTFAADTRTVWRAFHGAGPQVRLSRGRAWALFVDKELLFAGIRSGIDQQAAATAGLAQAFSMRVTRGSARPRWHVTDRGSEMEIAFDGTLVRACTIFWDIDLNVWISARGPFTLVERAIRENGRLIDLENVIRYEFEVHGGFFAGDVIGCALGGFFFGDLGRWIAYLYMRREWYDVLSASVGSTWGLPLGILLLFAQAFDPGLLPTLASTDALSGIALGGLSLRRVPGPGPVRFVAEISIERLLRRSIPGLRFSEIVPSPDGLQIAGTAQPLVRRAPDLEMDPVDPVWRLEPEFGCTHTEVLPENVLRVRNVGNAPLAFCPRSSREAATYRPVRFEPPYADALQSAAITIRPLDVPPRGVAQIRIRLTRRSIERFREAVSMFAGPPAPLILRIETTGGHRRVMMPWPLHFATDEALDRAQAAVDRSCEYRRFAEQGEIPLLPERGIAHIPGIAEKPWYERARDPGWAQAIAVNRAATDPHAIGMARADQHARGRFPPGFDALL